MQRYYRQGGPGHAEILKAGVILYLSTDKYTM